MFSPRRSRGRGPEVSLPITPMLDMAFQLLTFFLFTYHPSGLEGQMALALPAEAAAPPHVSQRTGQLVELPDLMTELRLVLRCRHDGSNNGLLSAIAVEDRTGRTELSNLEDLDRHLTKARANATASITLQGDARLRWEGVVQVMDVCRRTGFSEIRFSPPPDRET